jgi:hypothetical protein
VAFWCACVAIGVDHSYAQADGRPTLAGVWTATTLIERYNIGDWGTACGPRPAGRDVPGGQVTIREDGIELVLTGEGRVLRTSECWEQLPGLSTTSHSAADRSWRTRCASAPNDPRQTSLVNSIAATDTTLSLDEVGEYQFRIEGQNCTASARRTQHFSLVQRQSEPAAAATAPGSTVAARTGAVATPPGAQLDPAGTAAAPGPRSDPVTTAGTAAAAPRPVSRCTVLGPPVQVEVRPARKLLRPGDRFTFRTTAFDANGCVVDPRANWVLAQATTKVTLLPGGTVVVEDDANDGTADLSVAFAGRSAHVSVEVATPARYDALLSTLPADAAPARDEPAATVSAGASIGASSAIAADTARTRKTTFVLLIGVLALGLAALGLVLVRRAPVAPAEMTRSTQTAAILAPAEQGIVVTQARSPAAARGMICPSCRTEFPAGSTFCPHDGNRLVSAAPGALFQGPTIGAAGGICPTCGRGYDPGVRTCPVHGDDLLPVAVYRATAHKPAGSAERGKICPNCGGRYGGEAVFCGKDGTALVLVN